MVEVSSSTYDPDGDVTATTEYVDSNPADGRTSLYSYDWQDRQIYAVNPPDAQGRVTYTMATYDNLGEATETQALLEAAPGTVAPATDQLLAQSATAYDTLGQVYQTAEYGVNPQTGAVDSSPLVSNTWYDADGNVIKSQPAGADTFTKTAYDGLDRPTAQYTGYGQAADVSDDVIFEETDTTYDAAGNAIETADYQREPTATDSQTGPLSALAPGYVRATYTAAWYDGAGRQIAAADYGAPGSPPSRPDAPPLPATRYTSRRPSTTPPARPTPPSTRRVRRRTRRSTPPAA